MMSDQTQTARDLFSQKQQLANHAAAMDDIAAARRQAQEDAEAAEKQDLEDAQDSAIAANKKLEAFTTQITAALDLPVGATGILGESAIARAITSRDGAFAESALNLLGQWIASHHAVEALAAHYGGRLGLSVADMQRDLNAIMRANDDGRADKDTPGDTL